MTDKMEQSLFTVFQLEPCLRKSRTRSFRACDACYTRRVQFAPIAVSHNSVANDCRLNVIYKTRSVIGADIMIPCVPFCALAAGCGRQMEVVSPGRSLDPPRPRIFKTDSHCVASAHRTLARVAA